MEHLAVETLKNILQYIGDPRSLLSFERCCTRFRTILEDDDIWQYSCGKYNNLTDGGVGASYREKAFIGTILDEIRYDQKNGGRENIILSVLSPEMIRRIISRYIVAPFFNDHEIIELLSSPTVSLSFDIRGDTLSCLLGIVEAYMLQKFENAMLISAHASNGNYPIVTNDEIKLVERIQGTLFTQDIILGELRHGRGDGFWRNMLSNAFDREFSENIRFRLARRLASRAGVVKLSDKAMKNVTDDMLMALANLLLRPMLIHRDILIDTTTKFEYDSIDLWSDIPPAITSVDRRNGNTTVKCVIVPRQIEDSAMQLGGCNEIKPRVVSLTETSKVIFGENAWALSVGQTLAVAIDTAKRRYIFPQDRMGNDTSLESSDSDDYGSYTETDSDGVGAFSEYDDSDCPDCLGGDDGDQMEIDS